ncbi:Uncharacterised protein [Flavonifractor plautii]|uniref:Uncharacterized protein n=1 Tax=Flavonifractor plautii TaxID=292800 RepID=A0A174PPM0_FLAPL|nr:Uncharacterised protein [Flavonifractor plautii]
MVSSSTWRQPFRLVSRPGVVERIRGLGLVPRLMTTVSTSRVKLEPSTTLGARRPLSSGAVRRIFTHSRPPTRPVPSSSTFTGLVRSMNSMPSSLAWWTSSFRAGISSSSRR